MKKIAVRIMLQRNFLLIVCMFLVSGLLSLHGQIAINTENTSSYLLYVDGASTPATTNPSSGAVSAAQMADDVIITANGSIGIGTAPLSKKLTIKASSVGGAFKMADTSEGLYKALLSVDNAGVASWSSVAGTWYALLGQSALSNNTTASSIRKITNYGTSVLSDTQLGVLNLTTGDIKVPHKGAYRCTISGWMGYGRTPTNGSNEYYVNILYVYVNGVQRTSFVSVSQMLWGMDQNYFGILDLNAGDVLSLYKDETTRLHGTNTGALTFAVEFLY